MRRLAFFWAFPLLFACTSGPKQKSPVQSPPGYDFSSPETIKLPMDLDEISGMVFSNTDGYIIALNDEQGRLYKVPLDGSRDFPGYRFRKGGDYEDLCQAGTDLWALNSKGSVTRIRYALTDSMRADHFEFPLRGSYNFETLVYQPAAQRLLLLCKECPAYRSAAPGFTFDIAREAFDTVPVFPLDFSALKEKDQPDSARPLKASAAAYHPVTGELYVLASVDHRLYIADSSGRVSRQYKLDKKVFKQPEGICFRANGDLYISNEARTGTANIRKLVFQKP